MRAYDDGLGRRNGPGNRRRAGTATPWLAFGLLLIASGCAHRDSIDDWVVAVDVTGVWVGTYGRGGSAYSGGTAVLTLRQNGPKASLHARRSALI